MVAAAKALRVSDGQRAELERLGLNEQLSSQRSNGLTAMIERVRLIASQG